MNADRERMNHLTESVIGCAFKVGNTLGCGFLEKVYENALAYELRKSGLIAEQQKPIEVFYDGVVVGFYAADLYVEGLLLVELKVARCFDDSHLAQCLNYLKATRHSLGLLINFGPTKVEVKRVVNNF